MGAETSHSRAARDGGDDASLPALAAGLWVVGFVLLQATPFMLANPHSGPALSSCYAYGATGLLAGAWLGSAVWKWVLRAGRGTARGAIFVLAAMAALAGLEIAGFSIAVQGGPEAPVILFGPHARWPGVRPLLQGWEDPLLLAMGLVGGVFFTGMATRGFGFEGGAVDDGRAAKDGQSCLRLWLAGVLFTGAFALRAAFAAAFAGGLSNWWEQPPGILWLLVAGGWVLIGVALVQAARRWPSEAPALLSLVALGTLTWNALTRVVLPAVMVAGREGAVIGVALLLCAVSFALTLAGAQREGEDELRLCGAFLKARAGTLGESLAEREEACAALMITGRTSAEAAEMLGVGASTVRSYLQRAYRKLDVADGRELRQLYEAECAGREGVGAGGSVGRGDAHGVHGQGRIVVLAAGVLAFLLVIPLDGVLPWHVADALYLVAGLVLMTTAAAAMAGPRLQVGVDACALQAPRTLFAPIATVLAFCAQAAWSVPTRDGGVVFWVLAGAAVAFCVGGLAGPCHRRFHAMVVALGAAVLVVAGAPEALAAFGLVALAALAAGVSDGEPDAPVAGASSACGSRRPGCSGSVFDSWMPILFALGAALFFGTIISHYYTDALILNEVAMAALGGDGAVAGTFAVFAALLAAVLLASMAALGTWLRDVPLRAAVAQATDRDDARVVDRCRAHLRSLGLTDLQADIVLGIAEGRTVREIAAALHCSTGTINAARWTAYRRLGVVTRDQLAARLVAVTGTYLR